MTTVPELAARYAALVAINDAITGEKNKTSAQLREALWQQGLTKGTVATPLGDLTLRANNGGTAVQVTDEDALVGWCEVNLPDAVERITRVRAGDRTAILGTRFVTVADKVIDSLNGEVIGFAAVSRVAPAAPTPSYGASERQREVKGIAAFVAAERLGVLTDAMAERVAALDPPEFDKYDGEADA